MPAKSSENEQPETSNVAVKVPEDFQVKVSELLDSCTKEQLDFLIDCAKNQLSKLVTPSEEFSTDDMPE